MLTYWGEYLIYWTNPIQILSSTALSNQTELCDNSTKWKYYQNKPNVQKLKDKTRVSVKLTAPSTAPNSDTRLDLPVDPISLFSSFSTLLASFSTFWPFSFAPFSALFFPLHSSHVFLQTTVHHLEGSLDAGGPPHLPSSTLFGHNVCYFSLLLPHACFLVNTGNKTTLFWWKSLFCNSKELQHPDFWSHLFSWAIFSLSEMSTVFTTASAFFLACSIFFNIWKSSNSNLQMLCLLQHLWGLIFFSITVITTQWSYPPLLPGFGLSHSFDGPCVDLLPLFFILLHHLPGDRHRLPPVFLFILQ